MTAQIDVEKAADGGFRVTVDDGEGRTFHRVSASPESVRRYGGAAAAERLVAESFRFLLEREPKEAILSRFDLTVIERYFPEYPAEIRRRLG